MSDWLDELEADEEAERVYERRDRSVNKYGGSGEKEDRDGACTPKWIADALGRFDLDPCSNDRSHISAHHCVCLSVEGSNGLPEPGVDSRWLGAGTYWWAHDLCQAGKHTDTFCNPPYARGQVIRWARHYSHTNFTFLLRWDVRTKWFAELFPKCWGFWFPRKCEFEPPPGVTFSSNPYPHALYFRDRPKPDRYARLSAADGYFVTRS